MKKTINKEITFKILSFLSLIILLTISWYRFYKTYSIVSFFVASFFSLIILYVILSNFKRYKVIYKITNAIKWILGCIYMLLIILSSFFLIIISTVVVWASFTLFFKIVTNSHYISKDALLYCSVLFTLIILTYLGDKIIKNMGKILNVGASNKNGISWRLSISFLNFINMRRRIYEISIILYVLSVVEKLSNIILFEIQIWMIYKDISLEILLTFIAIDNYITNFIKTPRKNKIK